MNRIGWKKKAIKQLKKINRKDQGTIVDAIDGLLDLENCPKVKSLTNHQYDFRLRVGRYRVFFNHTETVKIVYIEEVKKRDERTY